MANSVYEINKGVNAPVEFKGLKAQYIWYLGGLIVVLLILFAILYMVGIPSLICIVLTGGGGTLAVMRIYRLSETYGPHGLMKLTASKRIPRVIRSNSRKIFRQRTGGPNVNR
ncbi:DUF4133 domain-containing protein [Olivibacter sp. 47]|jgi:hypothetical protein|uniref:DUF4133 domain-containing protein n=1 Tax=Olivibacter sp. 47 TaxID=3056486 RepID=UPI0025A3D0BB|nr:DUF4133 domain-containing protein [Olivibacter sp. 47]MDM8175991.1 DUF4133 domain-containing protein [Olivibacter sp. 47]